LFPGKFISNDENCFQERAAVYADDRETDAREQWTEDGAGSLLPKSVQVTKGTLD
jgi:hypothetical protein